MRLTQGVVRLLAVVPCVVPFVAVGLGSGEARGQCAPEWQAFDPSVRVTRAATMWDRDGPGPITPKLVVGGSFIIGGSVLANRIAVYDPETGAWSALGAGMNSNVWALATLPNGDLVAGGEFTNAGGVLANYVARWNGSAWAALGTGMDRPVYALTTLASGNVVAGGVFNVAGGVTANGVAHWDGFAWHPLGTGPGDWLVFAKALTTLPNGDVVAGGGINSPEGSGFAIVRWNGSAWSALGQLSGSVVTVATLPNGDVIAGGGGFTTAGGFAARYIARWNGSDWSALGTGISGNSNEYVSALMALPNGNLVVGGRFLFAGDVEVRNIARWNGSAWSALGTGLGGSTAAVNALTTLPNGDLVAGGDFTNAGAVTVRSLARYASTFDCYANCDCSSSSPQLTPADFTCFLSNYRNASAYADCDSSGGLSPADFTCFLARYRAGCP